MNEPSATSRIVNAEVMEDASAILIDTLKQGARAYTEAVEAGAIEAISLMNPNAPRVGTPEGDARFHNQYTVFMTDTTQALMYGQGRGAVAVACTAPEGAALVERHAFAVFFVHAELVVDAPLGAGDVKRQSITVHRSPIRIVRDAVLTPENTNLLDLLSIAAGSRVNETIPTHAPAEA